MRKILLVLSSISILIATPLTVVACKDKAVTDNKEYDYFGARAQMLSEITNIVNTGLEQDLNKYYFMSKQSQDLEKFQYINFNKIIDKINNQDGELEIASSDPDFSSFSDELKTLVRWETITNSVQKNVANNINYRPMIVSGRNLLTSNYSFKSISISSTNSGSIAGLNFEINWPVNILDVNGKNSFHDINYVSRISIFSDENEYVSISNLNESITSAVKSSQVGNNFSFISNSGDLFENIRRLKNNEVGTKLNKFFQDSVLESASNLKDVKFNYNSFNLNSDIFSVVNAAPHFLRSGSQWYSQSNANDAALIKPALINGGADLQKLADATIRYDSKFNSIIGPRSNAPANILNKLSENDFWGFNNLYLKNNIETSYNKLFDNLIKASGSDFSISEDNLIDGKALAVYPVHVRNAVVSYESVSTEKINITLPPFIIFAKQFHNKDSSKKFVSDWVSANIELYRELFGFIDKTNNQTNNISVRFSDEFFKELKFNQVYFAVEIFENIYDYGKERVMKRLPNLDPDLISGMVIRPFYDFSARVQISDLNNNLYFMNSRGSRVLFYQDLDPTFSFFTKPAFNAIIRRGIADLSLSIGGQSSSREPEYGKVTSGILVANLIKT
ncbi:hypothetical protein [Spiroplasma endosymbiont of Panorpa germanica]|uniref:hypothetical protein n=1 Tax=Spiroplasma endosymbiont of Panorpa germanica TaxID=3066314 RepID=UPI0030D4564D